MRVAYIICVYMYIICQLVHSANIAQALTVNLQLGTTVINIIAHVGGEGLAWVQGYSMCTRVRAQTLDKAGHMHCHADYSPLEWT